MILIKLTEKFALSSDSHQWMIRERTRPMNKKTKKREEKWSAWGCYCATPEQTIKHFAEYLLRTGDATTPAELIELAESITRTMKIKLKELIDV
jgi:hypothetical protein